MNRYIPLSAAAAGGGMLAAAFLSTAVAVAAPEDATAPGDTPPSDTGAISDQAFTAPDGLTFDPAGDEYDSVSPLFGVAPLLQIGGGALGGTGLATQEFDVFSDGDQIGTADTNVNVSNILGIESAQFTVTDTSGGVVAPDADAIASALQQAGFTDADFSGGDLHDAAAALADSDIDFTDGGISGDDVASALADSDVSLADTPSAEGIADALNSSDLGEPADVTSSDISSVLGDAGYSDDNFTGGDLNDAATAIAGDDNIDFSNVSGSDIVDALNGSGVALVDAGDLADGINANLDVSSGFDVSQVEEALTAAGFDDGDVGPGSAGVDLSDAAQALIDSNEIDLGSGDITSHDVYTALSDQDLFLVGGANNALVDNLNDLEPSANVDSSDVASALQEAGYSDDNFTGGGLDDAAALIAGDSDIDFSDVSGSDITDALNGSDVALVGTGDLAGALNAADLGEAVDINAGNVENVLTQAGYTDADFTGDNSSLSDVAAAIAGSDNAGDIATGNFTAADLTADLNANDISLAAAPTDADIADALDSADFAAPGGNADLPADGTVYSITDFTAGDDMIENLLGGGIYNFYEAVPTGDGGADITDVLVTPFGNIDLSTPFNAIADLMPGDAVAGVDASDNSLFGGLFGGGGEAGGGVETDASASDIAAALSASDTNFGGYDDVTASDIASALAAGDSTDVLGDDVSASEVTSALNDANVDISGADFDAGDIAGALNGADEGGGLFGDLF